MAKKKDDQKSLTKYLNRIEAAEKWRDSAYKELWTRCYKRWKNHVDALTDPDTGKEITDRSNISIPYTFVQVETILPRLVETLFASRPYVAVKDREPTDLPNAGNNEVLLDWQMNERMDVQDIFHTGLKGLAIYGTAVAFTGWRYQERTVIRKEQQPVIDEETGQPYLDEYQQPIQELQPVKVNTVEYDDNEVDFVDLGLFFTDPASTDIDDARYCGHISHMTKAQLEQKEDIGMFKLDWKKIPKDSKGNAARDYRMSSVGLPTFDDQVPENDEDALYEVIHYWEDDKYVAIINRAYIACDTENPYWHKKKPYDKAVYTVVPGEFYGIGIVEMVEDLQDELNAERNQRIDFRSMCLRRMFKVRRGSVVDKKQLKWRQNGIVEVDDMDDIREFTVADVPSSSFAVENQAKQDFQDTTGAHDVVMGSSDTSETATTTMSKDNNASMRFRLTISNIEKKLLVSVARKMLQNNQQFLDTDRVLRIAGENGDEWAKISPAEIQGEFDFVAMGSSVEPLANKEAFKQRMIELYGVATKDPIYQDFPGKRMAILRKVFEAFDIKETDNLVPTDEDIQQNDQKTQLLQQLLMEKQQGAMASPSSMPPPMPGGPALPEGGGANTAMMAEQGMAGGAI